MTTNRLVFKNLFAALALFACVGCAMQRSEEMTVVSAKDVRVIHDDTPQTENDDVVAVSDLWSYVPVSLREDEVGNSEKRAGRTALNQAAARRRATLASASRKRIPTGSSLPTPKAKSKTPQRVQGKAPTKSPERLAREHFIDYPTTIRAQRITFYCPPEYAHLVKTEGREQPMRAGRRVFAGNAKLTCRELTLQATRISWKIRRGDPDIQIAARGDVHFVSRVRSQVIREQGIKSLLITNDKVAPLR